MVRQPCVAVLSEVSMGWADSGFSLSRGIAERISGDLFSKIVGRLPEMTRHFSLLPFM